jgi:hypothetical protein
MNSVPDPTSLLLNRFHAVFALAIYLAISVLYFGFRTLPHLSQSYYGLGLDPTIHMWAMSWWPYAIAHRLNPLITPVIWAPSGFNLARAVSIPGPSMIMYPITRTLGPVTAYNLMCLACTTSAPFAAFLLCRYLCHCFWPAVIGGYIFGFSQYVLSQIGAHVFLLFIFPIPLAIYLVLQRLEGTITKYSFVVLFVLVIGFEFLSSTELFATTTLFGSIALFLSFVLFADLRPRLRSVIAEVILSYAGLLVILSPYLYYVVAGGVPPVANPAEAFSNDLLAFLVPTPVLFGGSLFTSITSQFKISWGEMAAYLGPGVWLVFALFAWSYWRTSAGKLLILSFAIIALFSLGPKLHIEGNPRGRLPWVIAGKLPLINLALPGRFGMYLFLVAALILATYLSRQGNPLWFRVLLGVGALAFIFPNLAFTLSQTTGVETPLFFQTQEFKRYISKGDIVLILPNDATSLALLWQAQANFYFRMVTGFYIGPAEYPRWPITSSFVTGGKIADFSAQLDAFLKAHQVKAIIVESGRPGPWPGMLSEAGMTPVATGGVLFYKVSDRMLMSSSNARQHRMS